MRAQIKYIAIAKNADKHPIRVMCNFFEVARSGYYAFLKRQDRPSAEERLAALIHKCQQEAHGTYGYRRVGIWLKRQGIEKNHKAVLRIMNKYGLLAQIRRRRKYRQMSDQLHRYPNVLNRNFTATRPNQKWVTCITSLHVWQ